MSSLSDYKMMLLKIEIRSDKYYPRSKVYYNSLL